MKTKIEIVRLDTTEMALKYKAIKLLQKVKYKSQTEKNFIRQQISSLRHDLQQYGYMVYKVIVSNGKESFWQMYRDWPKADEIGLQQREFKSKLKSKRAARKVMQVDNVNILGYQYQTVGGVFTKPNSIKDLNGKVNRMVRIKQAKKPHPKFKSHYIGVELELICKVDRDTLNQKFCDAGLAGYVYVKDDSSIHKEKDSERTHEVTILTKQEDASNIITAVCNVLNSEQVGSYVNNSCGMHMHFDMRNRNPAKCYKNMVAILPVLNQLVPLNRIEGNHARQYCRQNDISWTFENAQSAGRYFAINAEAFDKYQTLESRMHSGTTNAAKILNWMRIILSAIECAETLSTQINTVEDFIAKFNINNKLAEYMIARRNLFNKLKEGADTRSDHFYSNDYAIAI